MSGSVIHARTIRIATRASELALRQARQVAVALASRGVGAELVTYTTIGDRKLDQPLRELGAKGLFTHELEQDLLSGRVDCCVHSLKDLPTDQPAGLTIVAQLAREDPRDALVLPGGAPASLGELPPGSRVGTSSLRRRAQLLAARRDLELHELRGNVPTRLRKLDAGEVDAAILAAAGLHRLGLHDRVGAYLEPDVWLPAAGQGAIAVQVRDGDAEVHELLEALDDHSTSRATAAERAFLAALDGGCQVPIGALAATDDNGATITLYGMIAAADGSSLLRGRDTIVIGDDPRVAGERLARRLRAEGGEEILQALARGGPVPSPQPE